MKITKNKIAAASFGAALASLYSAPELCAQVDSNPGTEGFSFVPGTVPFFPGVQTFSNRLEAVLNGVTNNIGYGSPVDFGFFNDSQYGFAVNGASTLWVVEPGDIFDGYTAGGTETLSFGPTETGIRTIGFVAIGGVGYFRIDLGQPGDAVILLDGEVSVSADGNPSNNDFVITIPDGIAAPTLLGDVNLDGEVNFLDIVPFISQLSSGDFLAEADVDGNGEVNFLDIVPFIEILSGAAPVQVSWSDSTGKPFERSVAGNEAIEQQLQAIELKLNEELIASVAQSNNSTPSLVDEPGLASVGLASLATGAAGLRRRRKTATTVA